ncbi:transient receptor potential channel pyrexia [Anabrus simplex]|uniref:transient receptor potential channel pyrexia n=1 Tax=Anabrus simplex TaxID=316456 RepID=UPI0035A325BE
MWSELEKLQPLHLSVWRSSAAVLTILLQCDVISQLTESRDERGFTPLMLAALRGRTDCIQALLAEGADIRAVDSTKGHTALHKAALAGHRDALRLLINAAPNEIDKADFSGNTALMSAVSKGHNHCFEALVNAGANCCLRTSRKQTVLHLAAGKGHAQMLRAMLERPEINNLLRIKPAIKDADGRTCLVLAVLAGSAPCVNILLQNGVSLLSEIQEPWQQNPLYLAASRGSNEILQLLLLSYEYRQLHPSPEEGIEAARFGEVFLEDLLILHGTRACTMVENILEDRESDPRESHIFPEYTKAIGRYKNTCLHLAAQNGNVDTLETLYCCYASIDKSRVKINCRDLDKRNALHQTPLHIAAMSGSSECTKFLVQRGANLAATVNEPLWYQLRTESSALSFVLEHVPQGEGILCEVLDGCITLIGYLLGQQEILLDFKVLCPAGEKRLTVVEQLYRHRERRMHNLLQHPLVQTFIHLEWCKKRYSLAITVHFLIYLLYVSTLAIYLLVTMNNYIKNAIKLFLIILCVIVLTVGTPFLVLCHVSRPEKLYKIMTKTAPPVLTLVALPMDYKPLSSFALIFSWLALLHYTNSIPIISHKSAMFQYIMKKLIDHIIVFVFILAGFSFTFFLLYSEDKTGNFKDLWESVLSTTLVLLQGSLDGTPLFKNSSQTSVPRDIQVAGGVMQQLFVVTAVLALLNMWVGLAVRGGQELEDQGRIHYRRNQVQLLFVLEKLFQLAGLHDPVCTPTSKIVLREEDIPSNLHTALRSLANHRHSVSDSVVNTPVSSLDVEEKLNKRHLSLKFSESPMHHIV